MNDAQKSPEFPVAFVLAIAGVVVSVLPTIDACFRPLPTVTSLLVGLVLCVVAVRMRGEDRRVAKVCLAAVTVVGILYLMGFTLAALRR